MNIREYTTVKERRGALEKACGVSLTHTGTYSLDESVASAKNCENMIGVTQIPLGIAGPLRIRYLNVSHITSYISQKYKDYFLPLATTEGALVASISRGCKAIAESGGASVLVENIGATRGPVFRVESIEEGETLRMFIETKFTRLCEVAEKTSHHLTLLTFSFSGSGKYRYVRFVFDTRDAMGLNMVTIATEAICAFIFNEIHIPCINVSGNFCVDKKPSWQNFINKRGKSVTAEITVPGGVLSHILKTNARALYESWLSKCMIGSAISGSIGFNAQYANVVAALFIATGQDPAHVVEGSIGMTTMEVIDDSIYVSVYVPDIMVGTVGGGTGLSTQKEALEILGVSGGNNGNNAIELAAIVGGACLAGELSLIASLSEGSLGTAHKKLGRGER